MPRKNSWRTEEENEYFDIFVVFVILIRCIFTLSHAFENHQIDRIEREREREKNNIHTSIWCPGVRREERIILWRKNDMLAFQQSPGVTSLHGDDTLTLENDWMNLSFSSESLTPRALHSFTSSLLYIAFLRLLLWFKPYKAIGKVV